jgi:hypothetical protein
MDATGLESARFPEGSTVVRRDLLRGKVLIVKADLSGY